LVVEAMGLKRWAIPLLGLLVAAPGIRSDAQSRPEWDPRANPPGVVLALVEQDRKVASGITDVLYAIRASGFPKDKTYALWFWDSFTPKPYLAESNFKVDESGQLVSGRGMVLQKLSFHLSRFARGEPVRMAVISTDQTIKAYARAYPLPIEATDNRCHLWVELLAPTGKSFLIQGEGFEPGEEVTTLSTSGSEVIRKTQTVLADGTLDPATALPAVVGKDSGVAAFSVSAKSCAPTVQYEWGPPAMKVR